MISILIQSMSIPLVMAAMQGDPVESARIGYSNCLVQYTNASLDEKMANGLFAKEAAKACPDEKAAFTSAMTQSEMQFGSDAADAKAYAEEEVKAMVDSFTTQFNDFKSSNARMVEQ